MNGQSLDRRIAEQHIMREEVVAWEQQRNKEEAKIHWTLTVSDAPVKPAKIYPSIEI